MPKTDQATTPTPAWHVGSTDEFGAAGLTLKQKQAANVWDHIDDALAVIELARAGRWVWMENPACKYIELRIDMRDGGCLIKDREGNRINPADLRKQLSGEQWEPWPAERMPLGDWQKQMAKAAGVEPQAPTPKLSGCSPLQRRVGRLLDEGTNTSGPRGTYGCACVSRDARECMARRYPDEPAPGPQPDDMDEYRYLSAERCQCLCHEWSDDDENLG